MFFFNNALEDPYNLKDNPLWKRINKKYKWLQKMRELSECYGPIDNYPILWRLKFAWINLSKNRQGSFLESLKYSCKLVF